MVKAGGLATYGVKLLRAGQAGPRPWPSPSSKDGKKPGDMPIQYLQNLDFTVNTDIAKKLGITIPADLLAKAK